jgi:FkbM family methyltransferase
MGFLYAMVNQIAGEREEVFNVQELNVLLRGATKSDTELLKIMDDQVCPCLRAEWKLLCKSKLVETTLNLLQKGQDPVIVQVGAHIGFEWNDPVANGINSLIESSSKNLASANRNRFHWFFVEPSPPNYAKLEENIKTNKHIGNLHGINAGIISEEQKGQDMTFYRFSDTIDPESGYDSKSKKKFPNFITQTSSFNKKAIIYNKKLFQERGLDMEDYIVETKIPVKTINELMKEVNEVVGKEDTQGPLLLLIDAESMDCEIVLGISQDLRPRPHYIMYERNCDDNEKEARSIEHLGSLGYDVITVGAQIDNHIAVRKDLRQ